VPYQNRLLSDKFCILLHHEKWTTDNPGKCIEQACPFQSFNSTSVKAKLFYERVGDYPPGLRDQANPDRRTASTLECTVGLRAYSGCSYKANASQEWDFWLDQVPAKNLPCCRGKPALAALAAAVQESIILAWSHCSISLKKARAVQTKAQFCLCCWGTLLLQNRARAQQTVTS